jgi:hypothetical protein
MSSLFLSPSIGFCFQFKNTACYFSIAAGEVSSVKDDSVSGPGLLVEQAVDTFSIP